MIERISLAVSSRWAAMGTLGCKPAWRLTSIYTVLTLPSEVHGTANVDFVIFPPRWLVAEDTFRPSWYRRNAMTEFMGLVYGVYDSKAEGFLPGGASLHNRMTAHGPDAETSERASSAELKPHKIDNTLAFMFESRFAMTVSAYAAHCAELQPDYFEAWRHIRRRFPKRFAQSAVSAGTRSLQ